MGIITAVLCLALLVFLGMASSGKKPDGVKLRGIHRVPLDLFLAAALAAVAVPANFYSGINLLYNPLWGMYDAGYAHGAWDRLCRAAHAL